MSTDDRRDQAATSTDEFVRPDQGLSRFYEIEPRIDAGMAEPESPEARRMQHVLTNVLGGPGGGVHVDVHPYRLDDGDRVLLCTDGLTDLVADDEIARVLGEHSAPADACRALVDLALERGGRDNITVLVARYEIGVDSALEQRL